MDEYLIGAGAILTAGTNATIRAATLHAQVEPSLARQVGAALIDFESASAGELARVLIMAAGWSGSPFHDRVVEPLLARRECGLAEVMATLARAVGSGEVHLFARWLPDVPTCDSLAKLGIRVVAHPLEAIGQAALICGTRIERWRPPVRAA